jgi:predicted nuclease of predicted toxin-antitoxin system
MVEDPLVRAIGKISAIKSVYAGNIPELKGKDDDVIMDYANREKRIVFTTERRFAAYRICTNPGIVILTVRERHEAMRSRVFQRFIRSGHRKYVSNALTRLSNGQAEIKDHSGEVKTYRF